MDGSYKRWGVRCRSVFGTQGRYRDREIDDEVFSGKRGGQQRGSAHVGFQIFERSVAFGSPIDLPFASFKSFEKRGAPISGF
ncbi:unnamed protein product [Prunus armeniaca]